MSYEITITEALAKILTIEKRVKKQRDFVYTYLYRDTRLKDPLENEGGSPAALKAKLQSIGDLNTEIISLRNKINKKNQETMLTVAGQTMSVAKWLIFKREVMPKQYTFWHTIATRIRQGREKEDGLGNVVDIEVNLPEDKLQENLEMYAEIEGELDGKLSLNNATVMVTIEV